MKRCIVCGSDNKGNPLKRQMCQKDYGLWYKKQKLDGADLSIRTYPITLDLNETLWSPQRAWLMGIILGDGNVLAKQTLSKSERKSRRAAVVNLAMGDLDVVEKVRDMIIPGKPILFKNGTHRLNITSKDVAIYFHNILGIHGKKSPDTPYPMLIPSEFRPHLIRGLWDSDGHIGSLEGRAFLKMKTQNIVLGVAKDAEDFLGFKEGKDFNLISRPNDQLEMRFITRKSSIDFLDFIYSKSEKDSRCDRKYEEYQSSAMIEYHSDVALISDDDLCLVCGKKKISARGLCFEHYKKVYSSWRYQIKLKDDVLVKAVQDKKFKTIDWGIRMVIQSFYDARFNFLMSPAEYMDLIGINDENDIRSEINRIRKSWKVGTVSWFPTRMAVRLLSEYAQKGQSVFDPFAGWGGRLTACHMLGLRYVAFDINKTLVSELNKLIEIYDNQDLKVFHRNSALGRSYDDIDNFDYLITSPPYWIKEFYSDDIGQAHSFCDYEDFMDSLIYQMLTECVKRTRVAGYIVCKNLNIDGERLLMADQIVEFIEKKFDVSCSVTKFSDRKTNIRQSDFSEVLIKYVM